MWALVGRHGGGAAPGAGEAPGEATRGRLGERSPPQDQVRVGGAGRGEGGGVARGEVHDASVSASSPSALFFDFPPFTTSGLRSVMQAS